MKNKKKQQHGWNKATIEFMEKEFIRRLNEITDKALEKMNEDVQKQCSGFYK